jgi:hypothetical protein
MKQQDKLTLQAAICERVARFTGAHFCTFTLEMRVEPVWNRLFFQLMSEIIRLPVSMPQEPKAGQIKTTLLIASHRDTKIALT